MVINLNLRTAEVQRYIARLNLTGGMVVSLFFQGGNSGNSGGSSGEGARGGGKNENDNEDDAAPPPSTGMAGELVDVLCAYGQRVPRDLLALCPLFPPCGSAVVGGGRRR